MLSQGKQQSEMKRVGRKKKKKDHNNKVLYNTEVWRGMSLACQFTFGDVVK